MDWNLFDYHIPVWIYAPALVALWWAAGFTIKSALSAHIKAHAKTEQSRFLDVLVRELSSPLILLIFVSGPIALFAWTPLGAGVRERVNLNIVLGVVAILAGVIFIDRFLRGLITAYSDRVDLFRTAGGLIRMLERGLILAIGALVLLDTLGISITPIIASLGIGTLAVALALQPTLENLFAGWQIVVDRPALTGHFIRLESGEEGYVEKIGWRSTWIRLLSNSMLIIPNKQLAESRLLNYYYPSKDVAFGVELGAAYGSDLDRIERVTVEVAEAVLKSVSGGDASHKPTVRFNGFGDSRISFSVGLRAREFVDHYLLRHEFIKALHKRYMEEGIAIPQTIRAINVTPGPGAAESS